jgi:competence protein ComEA
MSAEGRMPETRRGRWGDGRRTATVALIVGIVLIAVARLRMQIFRSAGDEPPPASERPWPDMRLDLNTASAEELAALPGIGPALSERIVADRAANGPFTSVDDLQRVDRVGPVLVSEIEQYVVAE